MVVRVFLSAAAGLAAVLALQHALAFPVEGVNTSLPVGTELDDAEATCMHRLISIKNVAVLPKMPSAAVDHRAAGESGFRSLQHVVPEN